MSEFGKIIDQFTGLDREFRLELLLDYAENLPPLPHHLREEQLKKNHRVPECQTEVFLFTEIINGSLRINAEVSPESPTVRGIVSVLIHAFHRQPVNELQKLSLNLLNQLGLAQQIGTMRSHGIRAIVYRLKNQVGQDLKHSEIS
jgi:cysteine desulfuration protein SufE